MLLERIKYIFDEVWILNDEYLHIILKNEFIKISYIHYFASFKIYYNGIFEYTGLVQIFLDLPSKIEQDVDILNIKSNDRYNIRFKENINRLEY